jgi:hypothetical protein
LKEKKKEEERKEKRKKEEGRKHHKVKWEKNEEGWKGIRDSEEMGVKDEKESGCVN